METNANVQIIQDCYQKFMQGNIAGILDLLDPNVVWEEPAHPAIPYGGKRQGRPAVQDFFAGVGQVQVSNFEAKEYLASGDRVVVLGQWSGTVKATGKSFQSEFVMVWTVTNGKITRFTAYEDTAAVAAAFEG